MTVTQVSTGYNISINGVKYSYPNIHKRSHRISQVNDRIFVDGYEWTNGKWERTLRAMVEYLLP